jgi:hypothetical protein
MQRVAVSNFVKRQTPQSEFSHFDGTWEELLSLVDNAMLAHVIGGETIKLGYRDGVVLVEVCPDKFYTPVVDLVEGDVFAGEYKPRQPGEEPRRSTWVVRNNLRQVGKNRWDTDRVGVGKQKAAAVDVVLYRHDVLAEGNENSADAEWEIISINARPTLEEQPMEVGTLMHNHFGSGGGTKTNMTNDEFVAALEKSFKYWKNKGKIKPRQ